MVPPPDGDSIDLAAQASPATYRGIRGVREVTTTESPEYGAYLAKVRKYRGEAAAESADITDGNVYALCQILGKMLDVAGATLTRASFLAGARTIEGFQTGLLGPFTLKGRQIGILALRPIECCKTDGTFRSLGGFAELFS